MDGRNPFRTTLKPWETIVRWYLQGDRKKMQGFLGGPSTVCQGLQAEEQEQLPLEDRRFRSRGCGATAMSGTFCASPVRGQETAQAFGGTHSLTDFWGCLIGLSTTNTRPGQVFSNAWRSIESSWP